MLDDFIETNGINAQILAFDEEVATSKRAQIVEKTLPIVKTIVLAHPQGFILAVLPGKLKVDFFKIGKQVNTSSIRLATPEEVEKVTGYPVGGVPPISVYGTPTLIDEKVLQYDWVLAGGGTPHSLLKITPADILANAYEPMVASITQ